MTCLCMSGLRTDDLDGYRAPKKKHTSDTLVFLLSHRINNIRTACLTDPSDDMFHDMFMFEYISKSNDRTWTGTGHPRYVSRYVFSRYVSRYAYSKEASDVQKVNFSGEIYFGNRPHNICHPCGLFSSSPFYHTCRTDRACIHTKRKSNGDRENTHHLNDVRRRMECHVPGNPQDGQECEAPPRSPRMHSKDHVPIHVRDRCRTHEAQLICRTKQFRWGSAALCGSSASRYSSSRSVLLPEASKTPHSSPG